jgi:hypothetical protein
MKIGFIGKLLGLTALLATLTFAYIQYTQPPESIWFWGALIYYLTIGVVIGLRTQNAVISESNSQFFTGVMGAIGIRMLLSILFIAIYLMISDIKDTNFIIYYLLLYLFYTIFEISQLVYRLRAEKQSRVDNAKP